jgi:hypothetical protein
MSITVIEGVYFCTDRGLLDAYPEIFKKGVPYYVYSDDNYYFRGIPIGREWEIYNIEDKNKKDAKPVFTWTDGVDTYRDFNECFIKSDERRLKIIDDVCKDQL